MPEPLTMKDLSAAATPTTAITQLAQEVDKHEQNLYHINEIGAQESKLTQETLNNHRMEIEQLKDMIREIHRAATAKQQPINYSIETPPLKHKGMSMSMI